MNPYGGQHAGHGSSRYDGQSDANMYQAAAPPLGSSGAPTQGMNTGVGGTVPPTVGGGMSRPPHDGGSFGSGGGNTSGGRPGFSRQGSDMYNTTQQQQQQQQHHHHHQTYTPSLDPSQNRGPPPGSSSGLPPALQPPGSSGGGGSRPATGSANTAPSSIPQLPPLSTQGQPYQTSSRGSTAHSYSRSSPESRYPQTPSRSQMQSQTPQNIPFSPLGLADIRGQISEGGSEEPQNAYPFDNPQPSNCQYLAPWPAYAFDWCKWPVPNGESAGKMAIGSYLEDGHNYIQVLDTKIVPDPDPEPIPGAPGYGIDYVKTAEATHSYPVTRILWEPQSTQKKTCDLLATSGDHLRLWSLPQSKGGNYSNSITSPNRGPQDVQKLSPLALLSNSKSPEHTAPLTSLDWNALSPSLIITSSIDTTCTIWDIPSLTAKTQLIAHDKEVFDVRFCANSVDVFVSCGADGSVRMFDLRSLEHSTIIYEPSEKENSKASSSDNSSPTKSSLAQTQPLLRLAASPHDSHLLATFSSDSSCIRILDVRQPGQALLELQGHQASVNCIEWAPSRRGMLASGADDSMVLIWDLLNPHGGSGSGPVNGSGGSGIVGVNNGERAPVAAWTCDYEINNLSWAPQSRLTGQGGEWLGITGGRGIWGLSI